MEVMAAEHCTCTRWRLAVDPDEASCEAGAREDGGGCFVDVAATAGAAARSSVLSTLSCGGRREVSARGEWGHRM
jgi:hypothetical protein